MRMRDLLRRPRLLFPRARELCRHASVPGTCACVTRRPGSVAPVWPAGSVGWITRRMWALLCPLRLLFPRGWEGGSARGHRWQFVSLRRLLFLRGCSRREAVCAHLRGPRRVPPRVPTHRAVCMVHVTNERVNERMDAKSPWAWTKRSC